MTHIRGPVVGRDALFSVWLNNAGNSGMVQTNKVMNLVDFADGSFLFYTELSRSDFEKICKTSEYIDSYQKKYGIEVYKGNSGVLVADHGYYNLYNSFDDLNKILLERMADSSSQEIMLNKNPYNESFPEKSQNLSDNLLRELHIRENHSWDSSLLNIIENKILESESPYLIHRKYFINIVAIVGEVAKRQFQSEWVMKLASDRVTWNPCLKIKGKELVFFVNLYETIFFDHNVENPLTDTYLYLLHYGQ